MWGVEREYCSLKNHINIKLPDYDHYSVVRLVNVFVLGKKYEEFRRKWASCLHFNLKWFRKK